MKMKLCTNLLIGIIIGGLIVWGITKIPHQQLFGSGDNVFPISLNAWVADDEIQSAWANSLEEKLGVTDSTIQTSLDYLVKHSTSSLYTIDKTDGGFIVGNGTQYVLESGATARTSLGLGTMATETATNYLLTTYASTTFLQIAYASTTYLQLASTSPYKIISLPNLALTSKYLFVGDASNHASSTSQIIVDTNGYVGIATSTPSKGFSVGVDSFFSSVPYVNADPTDNNQLCRKSYVDTQISSVSGIGIFGDGSDGASTTASNITLTRDHYFTDWIINANVTVTTTYRIFVSGTLTNNGTITNAGQSGTSTTAIYATGASFGSLGGGATGRPGEIKPGMGSGVGGGGGGVIMIAARTLNNSAGIITVAGGKGGNAIASGVEYVTGVAGDSTSTSFGGGGGAGGAGATYSGSAGGLATTTLAKYGGFRSIPQAVLLQVIDPSLPDWHQSLIKGGAGGGGGGGSADGNNNGGGGGGGGGVIVLISTNFTSGTESVAGGAAGAGIGTGVVGSAGSVGTKIQITP